MSEYEFTYIHSLAEHYLQYVLQVPAFESAPSQAYRLLQRVAFSVQKEVGKNLKSYLDDFHVESIDTARIIFNQVMKKEFEDGIINWGKIVTIFTFGGVLLKKLPQDFLAEFIMNNTGEWIWQDGDWVSFKKSRGFKFFWIIGVLCASLLCKAIISHTVNYKKKKKKKKTTFRESESAGIQGTSIDGLHLLRALLLKYGRITQEMR
uniref:Bcl-2-related protein A1 n=1 Tax=Mus spicilegus TaxID=10103 RepID=A0A8C6GN16_MUSSI